jgi:eukaryotic-like serine/threonine-protein kinase
MTAGAGGTVVASDRYEIDPERPLPEYDDGSSRAFAATDLRDSGSGVYAILPDPNLPLRLTAISRLRRIDNNNLLHTLAWDVVNWPAEGRRRPVIIVDRPKGPRLFATPDARIELFREEPLVRRLLQPMTALIEELSYAGIIHRNIRAENLYLDGVEMDRAPIMLGECVSAPAGYCQPVVYETIECGMAHPAGRGEGSAANDFYALGVTAAFLLAGRNPLAGLSDEAVIAVKLAKGSYAALLNGVRIPTALVEVFRGLLNDDAVDRWGLEQLQMWLGGRRGSPKQQIRPSKASRPLEIGGHPYVTARSVAEALSQHWDEALNMVQAGAVDDWLRRGLADEDRIEAVNTAKTAEDGNDAVNDTTLTRICFALDPSAPIRMRNLRAMLDGVAMLLACRFGEELVRAEFVTFVRQRLIDFCLGMNARLRPDIYRLAGAFDRLAPSITRDDVGFGIERALYMLSPGAPCRSPLFERDYVAELNQLVPALERLAQTRAGALDTLVDRHVAAFVASRAKAPIAPELRALRDAKDHFAFALPAARVLAIAQQEGMSGPAPALCGMVATTLEPALERFHNRRTRDAIRTRIKEIAATGSLRALIDAVDNHDALQIDGYAFRDAAREYANAVQERERLEYERKNRTSISRTVASQVASLLSGTIATVAVLVTILMKLV